MPANDDAALREQVRDAADGILMDASVTFVALMRERGFSGERTGVVILEEWLGALEEIATNGKDALAAYQAGAVFGGDPLTASLDSAVQDLIEERREQIRKLDQEE